MLIKFIFVIEIIFNVVVNMVHMVWRMTMTTSSTTRMITTSGKRGLLSNLINMQGLYRRCSSIELVIIIAALNY